MGNTHNFDSTKNAPICHFALLFVTRLSGINIICGGISRPFIFQKNIHRTAQLTDQPCQGHYHE